MEGAVAVYFPACINRIFGRDPSVSAVPSLPEALLAVSRRAGYLSANRTCEMGMRLATGHPYESFVFLLESLSRGENEVRQGP
jgi:hypothetical protein